MAKRISKKGRRVVIVTDSGEVRTKLLSPKRYSSGISGRVKHPKWGRQFTTVQIIKAVDKIYNQETSDIERLARIYSVKE